jgi:hypothetical protein
MLRPPDPSVDVWRDAAGEICAFSYPVEGRFCMDWPSVARYCFDASGRTVEAWPDGAPPLRSVERVHRRAVVPAAMQHLGFETLHASAVAFSTGVVAFIGSAGAGKSTIARACAAAGAEHWADDTVVLDVTPGRVRAVAIAFDVALRAPSGRHFGDPSGAESRVQTAASGEAPVRALVFLDRGAGPLAVTAVAPGDGLTGLLPHACAFSMRDDRRRRLMAEQFLTLAAEVPVYRLSYPSDYSRLGDVTAAIAQEVAGLASEVRT